MVLLIVAGGLSRFPRNYSEIDQKDKYHESCMDTMTKEFNESDISACHKVESDTNYGGWTLTDEKVGSDLLHFPVCSKNL